MGTHGYSYELPFEKSLTEYFIKKKKKKLQKTKEYWVGAIKFSHGESLYKTKGSKERIMDLPLIW